MEYLNNQDCWSIAKKHKLVRSSPCGIYKDTIIDKGVNYFVLKLENLNCITMYSCEGHFSKKNYIPEFYLTFGCDNPINLRKIRDTLFDPCYLESLSEYDHTIRIPFTNNKHKIKILTNLASIWESKL